LNATFISLLHKVARPDDINKFRPVSLVESVHKFLAKVFASRLRKIIGKVVSPYQHAFITSHQISDVALIVDESMGSCLKSNIPSVLCQLNIEKAYDHVSSDFLRTILERMRETDFIQKHPLEFCLSISCPSLPFLLALLVAYKNHERFSLV